MTNWVTTAARDLSSKMDNLVGKNNDTICATRRNSQAAKCARELTRVVNSKIKDLTGPDAAFHAYYARDIREALYSDDNIIGTLEGKLESINFSRTRILCWKSPESNTKAMINKAIERLKELKTTYEKAPRELTSQTSTQAPTPHWRSRPSERSYQQSDAFEEPTNTAPTSSKEPLLRSAAQEPDEIEEMRGDFYRREPKSPPKKPTRMVESRGDYYLSEPESKPQKSTRMVEEHGYHYLSEPATNPNIDTRSAAQIREDYHYHK